MKNKLQSIIIPGIIILSAAFTRLIPHAPNFTPIGALALFSGAHLDKKSRFIIPLSAMFVSDIFLGFHATLPFVYLSFIIIILMGSFLQKKQTARKLLSLSLISSFVFFFITNFGVWATSTMYTKNFSGLMNAYAMGVPFFRNTLLSDVLYNVVLFYGFVFIENFFKNWLSASHLAKARED